jgi:hypothetical protein
MSPGMDTALTVIGFVVILPVAVFAAGSGSMTGMMMGDGMRTGSPKLYGYLVVAAIVLPPIVVLTLYVSAIVLACLASGSTFYYPIVALAAGAAAWFGISGGIAEWIDRIK